MLYYVLITMSKTTFDSMSKTIGNNSNKIPLIEYDIIYTLNAIKAVSEKEAFSLFRKSSKETNQVMLISMTAYKLNKNRLSIDEFILDIPNILNAYNLKHSSNVKIRIYLENKAYVESKLSLLGSNIPQTGINLVIDNTINSHRAVHAVSH